MDKNLNFNASTNFVGKFPKLRHLNPVVYKKFKNTRKFIEEDIKSEEFVDRGGLDLKTYNTLQQIWQDRDYLIKASKHEPNGMDGKPPDIPYAQGPSKTRPVVGEKKALVLLVEFKDKKGNTSYEHFRDMLFNSGFQYSLKNYYREASWNQLNIDGYVNDEWYSVNHKRQYYVDTTFLNGHFAKAQELVEEAVKTAKSSNKFNFSDFAKNGEIELLIVIYAGSGLDTKLDARFIRPHTDRLRNPIEVEPGIWAKNYCIVPELPSDDLGCFCHEVGHLLGLPDFYKEGYSTVVGGWCLMGVGDHNNGGRTPAHPSAWCKIHLGWTEPTTITELPQIQNIPAVNDPNSTNKIYKIPVKDSNGKEYFLIENRQQKGFDQGLPASGLLIWHVNESKSMRYFPNNDPQNFFLTLEQSDGRGELEKNMFELKKKVGSQQAKKALTGDNGDPFPGETKKTVFDDKSLPNSRSHNNKHSCVVVNSISNSDNVMTAIMGVMCSSPLILGDKEPLWEEIPDDDRLRWIKEESSIDFYQNGYSQGYRKGYGDALKNMRK